MSSEVRLVFVLISIVLFFSNSSSPKRKKMIPTRAAVFLISKVFLLMKKHFSFCVLSYVDKTRTAKTVDQDRSRVWMGGWGWGWARTIQPQLARRQHQPSSWSRSPGRDPSGRNPARNPSPIRNPASDGARDLMRAQNVSACSTFLGQWWWWRSSQGGGGAV